MPWWAWSLVASVTVLGIEYLNRTVGVGRSFWETVVWTGTPIVLAQFALHGSYSRAPTLFLAWAVFTVVSNIARVGVGAWALGEPPTPLTLGGIVLIIAGGIAVKLGVR